MPIMCDKCKKEYRIDRFEIVEKPKDSEKGPRVYFILCPKEHLIEIVAEKFEALKEKLEKGKEAAKWKYVVLPTEGKDVARSLIPLVIGIVLAALLGSMWFFLAFLAWTIYMIIPEPENPIEKRIRKIKEAYEKLITRTGDEKERSELMQSLKTAIDIERVIAEVKEHEVGSIELKISTGRAFIKGMLKLGGLGLFSFAFLLSPIPFAKPVGIIVMFIAYLVARG